MDKSDLLCQDLDKATLENPKRRKRRQAAQIESCLMKQISAVKLNGNVSDYLDVKAD